MYVNIYLLWLFVTTYPSWSFQSSCYMFPTNLLSDSDCSYMSFIPTDKDKDLAEIKLQVQQNNLTITSVEKPSWTSAFLRISIYQNEAQKFCSPISNDMCISFGSQIQNEAFLIEYKLEKVPEVSSRKFIFYMPERQMPLFLYVDFTFNSHLILKAQKLSTMFNISYYKVQAYKERNNVTTLVDLRHFSVDEEILYDIYTYNDEGNYYFSVDTMYGQDILVSTLTPKIFVGRKRTRLVIGIVGASFILPFVLFVFHILTKKYPENSESDDRLVVAYRSSFKKHNEVVSALVTLIQKLSKNHMTVDVIDLSKTSKRNCGNTIMLARRVLYVAPPIQECDQITIHKSMAQKETFAIIFDHCTDKLPNLFNERKTFKLLEDFDRFARVLNLTKPYDRAALEDLRVKTEDAKIETDLQLNADILPKIIVTTTEPAEHDALISAKIDL